VEIFLQYVQPAPGQGTFVAIVHDINKRLAREQEKEQLQSRLLHTQKLESVGQLAAGIAHEINTPVQYVGTNIDFLDEAFTDLTALIKQFLSLLAKAQQTDIDPKFLGAVQETVEEVDWDYLAEEIPEAINQSKDGVRRVTSIVQAMKEFSHPGSREKVPINLNRLIETTVTVARNEWKYVAEVKTDFAENLPQVPCLSDEMGQVILNLLVNAAHAIADKQGKGKNEPKGIITIATRLIDNRVEIRVQDTGSGIPEEILKKIFDPFFTTKEVGKGTGQGLAIARDVISNKHDGTLEVESVPGEGATFIIRLPLE
jgi:signal transduction histidine kinase